MLAVAVLCAPDGARASGCFGGEPDIRPRDGERNLPINTQARLARRNPMSVSWIAPDGRKLPFGERWVGAGRSTGRLLNPAMPLSPGMHT
ncbi:MAG: hypothetical protein ACREJU_17255, partial [Nitrospiraceae bacterium]